MVDYNTRYVIIVAYKGKYKYEDIRNIINSIVFACWLYSS